eukprot:2309807-Prymnesium_polylepis.1
MAVAGLAARRSASAAETGRRDGDPCGHESGIPIPSYLAEKEAVNGRQPGRGGGTRRSTGWWPHLASGSCALVGLGPGSGRRRRDSPVTTGAHRERVSGVDSSTRTALPASVTPPTTLPPGSTPEFGRGSLRRCTARPRNISAPWRETVPGAG